jgi:hypothetical protein
VKDLIALLHSLRDGLLLAIGSLERDDELEAVATLEETLAEGRRRLEELRAA